MKNITSSADDLCPHCKEACDYTYFKRSISKVSKHDDWHVDDLDEKISDFFFDNIFLDAELENFRRTINMDYRSEMVTYWGYSMLGVLKSSVIVHVRFFDPEIDLVDVSYSTWDKFANFGGNFGIFAEITGCSFLGMLNFVILVVKFITSRMFMKCKSKIRIWLSKKKKNTKKDPPKTV